MKISVIVPAYNERNNIGKLIEKLNEILKKEQINFEIIIVDDYSPDGTGDIVKEYMKKYKNVKLLQKQKEGLGAAVRYGFSKATGNLFVVMDADLSHPPETIPIFVNAIEREGYDIVLGSSWAKGAFKDVPFYRRVISWGANMIARVLFLLPVKDPMSGFFAVKSSIIKRINLKVRSFKILLEILVKAKGAKIKEVPMQFIDRKGGKSKLGIKEIIRYLKLIVQLRLGL